MTELTKCPPTAPPFGSEEWVVDLCARVWYERRIADECNKGGLYEAALVRAAIEETRKAIAAENQACGQEQKEPGNGD